MDRERGWLIPFAVLAGIEWLWAFVLARLTGYPGRPELIAHFRLAAIIGCFYPGLNLGIDFRGGASMEVSKPAGQVLELDKLRGAVSGLDLGDVQVQGIARRDTNLDDGSTAIVRCRSMRCWR